MLHTICAHTGKAAQALQDFVNAVSLNGPSSGRGVPHFLSLGPVGLRDSPIQSLLRGCSLVMIAVDDRGLPGRAPSYIVSVEAMRRDESRSPKCSLGCQPHPS